MPIVTLKFYARGHGLVYDRTRPRAVGQFPAYVGRERVVVDGEVSWRATKEPHVMRLDTRDMAQRDLLQRWLPDQVKDDLKAGNPGALWPADEVTAKAMGVPVPDLTFADGEWVEKPKPPADPKPAKK